MSVVKRYHAPGPVIEHGLRCSEGCRREADDIFVLHGSDLRPRRIRCNGPARAPVRARRLSWHSPALYVLVLPGVLLCAVVASIVRKRFVVSAGPCDAHARRRMRERPIGCAVGVAAVAGVFFAPSFDAGRVAAPLGVLALIATSVRTSLMHPLRIDDGAALHGGFGEPFLASIGAAKPG